MGFVCLNINKIMVFHGNIFNSFCINKIFVFFNGELSLKFKLWLKKLVKTFCLCIAHDTKVLN